MSQDPSPNLPTKPLDAVALEQVLIRGNLATLSPEQKVAYYKAVCDVVGLNPLTKPFEYIELNGKLVLYALKAATDQLRKIHEISIKIAGRETIEGVYVVTAAAQDRSGRVDESTGAVQIAGLRADALANALMKAETKAKRRVTLSICGLGMLDETEVETIAQKPPKVFADQPGTNDGVAPKVRANLILNGANARKRVEELAPPELEKEIARLETMESPSVEDLQTLERAKEFQETVKNMAVEGFFDDHSGKTPKPICQCGSALKLSQAKGVYYCAQFKTEGKHIKPIEKSEYESI